MRIGILGGGQLARMLALAGHPLGMEFAFLCPDPVPCAAALGRHLHAEFTDKRALAELAAWADVVTFEFENVPAATVAALCQQTRVHPPAVALSTAQDRLSEKALFDELDIPVPPFMPVAGPDELAGAAKALGLPAILKSRRLGYDGKGQAVIRTRGDLAGAWERAGARPAILEKLVAFDREVSVIGARGQEGETRFYPLAENTHEAGILRLSVCRRADPMQGLAEDYAARLMKRLNYVGVLAVEFFQTGETLWANEFAPRVHNTGHYSIEGTETSQFENHLRAVAGLPLGATGARGKSAMVNFIGTVPPKAEVLAVPGAHLHDYAKAGRSGRKVGHATVTAMDEQDLADGILRLTSLAKAVSLHAEAL